MHAVRSGNYKLVLPHQYRSLIDGKGRNDGLPIDYEQRLTDLALFDLSKDIGETENIIQDEADIAAGMLQLVEKCRTDMGDAITGKIGVNTRDPGLVNPN